MPKAAKGKQGKLRSALQQVQRRKAKTDAARRAQENIENKRKSVARKAGGGNKKRLRGPFFPYRKHNTILLIGEGNFSFAHSIAERLGSGVNIVATAYDSQQVVAQKYTDDAAKHIAAFEALGGTVLYDIDGTALESHLELKDKSFTHIVFNFPHAGAGIKDQTKNIQTNQMLMIGFFTSAQHFLNAGVMPTGSKKGATGHKRRRGRTGGNSDEDDNSGSNDDSDDSDGEESGNDEVAGGANRSRQNTAQQSKGASGLTKRTPEASSDGVFDFEGAQATVVYDDGGNSDDDINFGDLETSNSPVAEDEVHDEFRPNLNFPGQIHVTLKSGLPYDQWNIKRLARECGLISHTTHPFELDAFPGYEHRRTLGFKQGLSKDENQEIRDKAPKLYAFCVKPEVEQADNSVPDVGDSTTADVAKRSRVPPATKTNSVKPKRVAAGPRLTVEEKRKRMMDIFYESQEPFLLKELEKIGPKQKGIGNFTKHVLAIVVSQTVKDVVQSLVDDGMCHCEKIGTSNYYWAFPSESAIKRQTRLKALEKDVEQMEAKRHELVDRIDKAQLGREQTDERTSLNEELAEIEAQWNAQQTELQTFKECDPVLMNQKRTESTVARDAANRWTDNIFIIQSWVCEKFNMDTADFAKHFGIPPDMDSV
ncbi:Meiotic nuclear division protein 1 [Coemansia furcata]|nr:Meiotic nuclear division protein 1 [Coemansia furcata]